MGILEKILHNNEEEKKEEEKVDLEAIDKKLDEIVEGPIGPIVEGENGPTGPIVNDDDEEEEEEEEAPEPVVYEKATRDIDSDSNEKAPGEKSFL